ncbi:MAG: RNA polymerase factor sigma-54 [Muribaculaceae bacterium]|nr:RNA polymerase factor sigma-54 [Muribaculaceae bacterium]
MAGPKAITELQQTQRLRLSQQQLRFVRLLELNAREFDETVESELEENPALCIDEDNNTSTHDETPYYLRHINNSSPDGNDYDFTAPDESETLYDHLLTQIGEQRLPEDVTEMSRYIVGNLDSNGRLQRPLRNILDDLAINTGVEIPEEVAEQAMEVVRGLDPAGVGAVDLQDCLLLQLGVMPDSTERNDAINILRDYFDAYTKKHSHKIISGLKISPERVTAAGRLIRTLNPKPGAAYGSERETAAAIVYPDFTVSNEEGLLSVTVNNRFPALGIEQSYVDAVNDPAMRKRGVRRDKAFTLTGYNNAREFIENVRQRQKTLLTVMTAIVSLQREYFETGDVYTLRPMMIKDISAITGQDLSVISRATNNKYVETPWGAVKPLRELFSNVKGDEEQGETLTNRQIEAQIEAIIEDEDKKHPLSDAQICEEMQKRGYTLSRRTIAKYRDAKQIPVARLRKHI